MREFIVFGLRYLDNCAYPYAFPHMKQETVPTLSEIDTHLVNEGLMGTTVVIHWVERLDDGSDLVHPGNRCVWDGFNLYPY
jgi:hypothetical protein